MLRQALRIRGSWRSSFVPRPVRSFGSSSPVSKNHDDDKGNRWTKYQEFLTKELINKSLLGVGQVIFLNNPQSGMILLGALAYGNPFLASMAAYGTLVSTSTAHFAGLDRDKLQAGLYGYNGCLVGCASAVFVDSTILATTAGALLCPFVGVALDKGVRTTPQWTLAFNAVTLSILLRTKPLQVTSSIEGDTTVVETASVSVMKLLSGPLKGISQIFVVESSLSGLAILGGIALYSPLLAAHAIMGSTVGTLTGAVLSAPSSELAMGLWGFNSALTSMAIGVFFVPNRESTVLSVGGAAATAVLFGAMKTVMGDALGAPALTLPFCATATGCYWLAGNVPGLLLAKDPHSPEKNKL
ncbi:solute carrier family 14 [Fistulifera solaris]|uniref:Solute carrier family 14 n=1 Tax=Fistulifera solaris TaxID=1519565 RepID=A0A1Z5KE44_FISSO|nr:solute carrier family 14 [Fistulifera solaris]|eukprot:GAX24584.1 solute carrier family 14 [Fistulifera solaris]